MSNSCDFGSGSCAESKADSLLRVHIPCRCNFQISCGVLSMTCVSLCVLRTSKALSWHGDPVLPCIAYLGPLEESVS